MHVLAIKVASFDRLLYRIARAHHLYIFVLVVLFRPWHSSVNYDYDDRGASSELRGPVRSTRLPCKFSAAVLHRAPLRTASGRAPHAFGSLPDLRAPHVFGLRAFRMAGKSHLPPAAERKASANKQRGKPRSARQKQIKTDAGKAAAAALAKAVVPAVAPAASRLEHSTVVRRRSQNKDHEKVGRQSRTVAGSTEGRKRSRCSSSRREASREESTETTTAATAARIGTCNNSSVRRSAPRRQQLGQRGGTATSTPSHWHGMLSISMRAMAPVSNLVPPKGLAR